jgi:hypothetical protein
VVVHSQNWLNRIKPTFLVVGIVCIAVFDLAFTKIVSLPAASDIAARVPTVFTDEILPIESRDTASDVVRGDTGKPVVRLNKISMPGRHRAASITSLVIARSKPIEAPARPLFASRRIVIDTASAGKGPRAEARYSSAKYTVTTIDHLAQPRVEKAKANKRNFLIAKALPVIKKPWQWMKMFAANLK